jgi:D-arabinose 1-dehydrogenase-like Zn-dependent alcohol dehydrogenase
MRNRILVTEGQGHFIETVWRKPKHTADEIYVKAVMTGICRSDIDMMMGKFGPLPLHMQGHEGLAQVVEVGKNIDWVKPGDYVATRGEPAFSDHYNVRSSEFVLVPSADPKYIVEPVACGINVVMQAMPLIRIKNHTRTGRLLILGSGFLAYIAYQTLMLHENLNANIDVVGNSNREKWHGHVELKTMPEGQYDVVIDLKDDLSVLENNLLTPGGVWVIASEKSKELTTNFSSLLWNATTIICPSPRNKEFAACMDTAVRWIEEGSLDVDNIWTKGYNRDTEWQQAFEDGVNRPTGYSRGYLSWL